MGENLPFLLKSIDKPHLWVYNLFIKEKEIK